jgi:hypothetical protein
LETVHGFWDSVLINEVVYTQNVERQNVELQNVECQNVDNNKTSTLQNVDTNKNETLAKIMNFFTALKLHKIVLSFIAQPSVLTGHICLPELGLPCLDSTNFLLFTDSILELYS